jgi:cutinase
MTAAYHQPVNMGPPRRIASQLCAATLMAGAVLSAPMDIPSAAAEPCPDIEVVFARGTGDAPGLGPVGQSFVDSLRTKVGGRSVGVYAVNYAATMNFLRVADGVADANNHVQYMVGNCPATRLVLGGFSQGAAVIDVLAVGGIPGVNFAVAPLSPEAANHVAAIAVFGNPMNKVLGPLNGLSPVYGPRTIDLCNADDPICGEGEMDNRAAHHQYVPAMTDQAASFVAGLV